MLGVGSAAALSANVILAGFSGDAALISKHLLRLKDSGPIAVDRCPGGWDPHSLSILRATPGVIVTDNEELALVDPQPNVQFIELMMMNSMVAKRVSMTRELLGLIRQRRIAAFALNFDGLDSRYRGRYVFWPELRSAIADNY